MNELDAPADVVLDEDEQWYEDHYEEFVSGDPADRAALIAAAAKPPRVISEKKQMISIRLDPADVVAIKEQAERFGLGYQTMISSLLHQYVRGDLVNIDEARKALRV